MQTFGMTLVGIFPSYFRYTHEGKVITGKISGEIKNEDCFKWPSIFYEVHYFTESLLGERLNFSYATYLDSDEVIELFPFLDPIQDHSPEKIKEADALKYLDEEVQPLFNKLLEDLREKMATYFPKPE